MSKISSLSVGVAVGGPLLAGALLGLREGPAPTLALALGLPVVVGAVALLTAPTLYVGGAVLGGHLSLAGVVRAAGRSLQALGLALLGLAPLSLLLATTSAVPAGAAQLGLLVVAMMIAIHRLATELDAVAGERRRGVAWHLMFAGLTAISFIIGARLFNDLVVFSARLGS
jgi:hypothetical protein